MALADVTYLVTTNADFAAWLCTESQAALKATGLDLDAEELTALLKVLHRKADPSSASTPLPRDYIWF